MENWSVGSVAAERCRFGPRDSRGGGKSEKLSSLAIFCLCTANRVVFKSPGHLWTTLGTSGPRVGPLVVRWGDFFHQKVPRARRPGELRRATATPRRPRPTDQFFVLKFSETYVPGQIGSGDFISAVKTRREARLHGVSIDLPIVRIRLGQSS